MHPVRFFHLVTLLLDGDDEQHLHPSQKLEHLPGVELPVKAEYFNPGTSSVIQSRHRAIYLTFEIPLRTGYTASIVCWSLLVT